MTRNDSSDRLLEPFRIALRLEREGKRFFARAAAETTSRLARQTFEFLAAEEDKHIEQIERFFRSLEDSGMADLPDTEDSDAEAKLASFNDGLSRLKEKYPATDDDIKAYRMALEFENGAEDFYQQKLDEADNPRIRKFYRWLIDEETMHCRLLKSCLNFVEDPAAWFKKRKG
ncbi:MAG: ferritin family protein [candidate division Zixibacteria bacterium]|nr:ferritin family protein [candidate division Zixibacteria bacterium]